jgi:hypothetical protein
MTTLNAINRDEILLPKLLLTNEKGVKMVPLGPNRSVMKLYSPKILVNWEEDKYGKWQAKVAIGNNEEVEELRKLHEDVQEHAKMHWNMKKPLEFKSPDYKGTFYVQYPVYYHEGERKLAQSIVEDLTDGEYDFWADLQAIIDARGKQNMQPSKMNVQIRLWVREEESKYVLGYNYVLDGISF